MFVPARIRRPTSARQPATGKGWQTMTTRQSPDLGRAYAAPPA
ncbi:hypothetical protein [Marinobacter mobilis]|nr:hypothetical protein [Marinobacter mobilis]